MAICNIEVKDGTCDPCGFRGWFGDTDARVEGQRGDAVVGDPGITNGGCGDDEDRELETITASNVDSITCASSLKRARTSGDGPSSRVRSIFM